MRDTLMNGDVAVAASQYTRERMYWLKQLSGEWEKSILSYDYSGNVGNNGLPAKGNTSFSIYGELFSNLMKISSGFDHTLHMILAAGIDLLIHKYSGRGDIIIGSPIYKQEVEGRFINTVLALRNRVQPDMTFKEFLLQVRTTIMEADEHQNYPLETLLYHLGMSMSPDDFPLFDIAVLLENIHEKRYIEDIHLNMIFSFRKTTECLAAVVEYNTARYQEEAISRIIGHFIHLLQQAVRDVEQRIGDIDVLPGEERKRLLYDFNVTEAVYPEQKTMHCLFKEQAEQTPDKAAVKYMDQQLTFKCLNEKSHQLASMLIKRGVKTGSIVGLMMERSLELMVGILGILNAGGVYLPIDPEYPRNRIISMLDDAGASILLTLTTTIKDYSFVTLQSLQRAEVQPCVTGRRPSITDFDQLPIPDRSLVNYEEYNKYIGLGLVKNSITLQATRGCPYKCSYCYKIWPTNHVYRSAENIFSEVKLYYDMGVRRFSFIDDVFNLNIKNSRRFFELVIESRLDLQMVFPSGLRGDILTKDYIDLMVEAGTIGFAVALETASPRLQKLIGKNLNIEKLRENIQYICEKYPHIILDLFTMHGLPTETEAEALMTLDFIRGMKWIHFPLINVTKIYPNTDLERLALESGITHEAIHKSEDLAFHDFSETLPFEKNFTVKYQADFLNTYFLSRERLLHVLPYQMKALTEDELIQKYNSYLPTEIGNFDDLLEFIGITREELGVDRCLDEARIAAPGLTRKLTEYFPVKTPDKNALRVLLLDLSQSFSQDMQYLENLLEPPLGLMYLLTYLNRELGGRVMGKIAKSLMDFDNYDQLRGLLLDFKPDVIGIRTLSFYRNFFHKTAALIRQWGFEAPIIAGGPHATSDYNRVLKDRNIDLVVLGEGEVTFTEVIEKIIAHGGTLPPKDVLMNIAGIAFVPDKEQRLHKMGREVMVMDRLHESLYREFEDNRVSAASSSDPAYVIYTSGSTGRPKGVMVEHKSLNNFVHSMYNDYNRAIGPGDHCLSLTSISFDVSLWELFLPLSFGAKVVFLPDNKIFELMEIVDTIVKEGISLAYFPPGLLKDICDHLGVYGTSVALNKLLVGVEPIKDKVLDGYLRLHPSMRILNGYGPTETTVCSSVYKYERHPPKGENVPIGKPLANTTLVVLNSCGEPVPAGVPGELCISGVGLARGYLNRPELTAERFVENPCFPGKGMLMYRTGDLVKWGADGNLQFLGRVDRQVKIRGYRIELGEVQSQLSKYPQVKEAVVIARQDSSPSEHGEKNQYLCAYIVSDNEQMISRSELREFLSHQLPLYMIPSFFVQVPGIPLNPSGKVDRKALPEPEAAVDQEYTPPRDPVEETMLEIFCGVLGLEKESTGIGTNFFDAGGHSLKAVVLIAKIHKKMDVKIPLADIFTNPTIRELAQCVKASSEDKYTSIKPATKKEFYLLSSQQKRLYFLQEFESGNINYNCPLARFFEFDIDKQRLEHAFNKLIGRHESLRTSFGMIDGQLFQTIQPVEEVEFAIHYNDFVLNKHAPSGKERIVEEISEIFANFVKPFDLTRPPLLRVGLIKMEENKSIILIDLHHIIADGVSMNTILKDLIAVYFGEELPPLSIQYKDYAEWQNKLTESGELIKQEKFWLNEFETPAPTLIISSDNERPAVQSFEGNSIGFEIGAEETTALNKLSKFQDATLFMTLLSVFNVLLFKLSGQEDIVVGTPIACRSHADLENVVGMFVNTLSIRNRPQGNKPFDRFLGEVREKALQAFENQEYQLDDLVEKLGMDRDIGRNPIFDITFGLQNQDEKLLDVSFTKAVSQQSDLYDLGNFIAKFDMTLAGIETSEKVMFSLEYSTKLFKRSTIERYIGYFKKAVSSIIKNPRQKIWEIDILTSEEKTQVLVEFNNTYLEIGFSGDKPLHELFEEQAAGTPGGIAVIGGWQLTPGRGEKPGETVQLSYKELNERSNRLARVLMERGVGSDAIVAIMVEPSIEMVIGILGILKAGGAYLPIEPDYPGERIDYMIKDSNAMILLKKSEIRISKHETNSNDRNSNDQNEIIPGIVLNFEHLDFEFVSDFEFRASNFKSGKAEPSTLAYIIYTSGTSGQPKGVMVDHRGIVNYTWWRLGAYNFKETDTALQLLSYCFDGFGANFYSPLLSGAAVVMLPSSKKLDFSYIKETVKVNGITNVSLVPPMYEQILDCAEPGELDSLRFVVLAGEKAGLGLIEKSKEKCPAVLYINEYGPTEASVTAAARIGMDEDTAIIGKPISKVQIYIVDAYFNPVPTGVTGEIHIAGAGVARGYLNRPELTAEKFNHDLWDFQDSHDEKKENYRTFFGGSRGAILQKSPPGRRGLYKTGDLGCWLSDGTIRFIGRMDGQVKIRGFRIEPGEIEEQLLTHADVKRAALIERTSKSGDTYLCAYLVLHSPHSTPEPGALEFKEHLSHRLPGYMIPSYFFIIPELPLTTAGKIDRKRLPDPGDGGAVAPGEYVPPSTFVEKKLAFIWQKVLGRDEPGIHDDFFLVGGNSLKATGLISHINKEFNVKVPLPELFLRPTVKYLARYIEGAEKANYVSIEPAPQKEYHPTSSQQKRMYFLQQIDVTGTPYNCPMMIPLEGDIPRERLKDAFIRLIARHESLRTSFKIAAGQPVQEIHREVEFEIEYYEGDENVDVREVVEGFVRPFDLSAAPLLRVGLVKQEEDRHLLMVDMHHVTADDVSMTIILKDFTALYSGETLPELRLQYKDYAEWQNSEEQKESVKQQEAYWLDIFKSEPPVLHLPWDYSRPASRSAEGNSVTFELEREKTNELRRLAREKGVTMFMLFLASYNVLLSKLSRQEEIVVGFPVAGRRHADIENIVGLFVNILALRNYPSVETCFSDFLNQLKENTLAAFENQDYQVEDLVERVVKTRDKGRIPLFDVMFHFIDHSENSESPGVIDEADTAQKNHQYLKPSFNTKKGIDLLLSGEDTGKKSVFLMEYNTSLFKEETVGRFINYFKNILDSILEDPGRKIIDINILSDDEENRLLDKMRSESDNLFIKKIKEIDSQMVESSEAEFDF
jgi:amino acid adenylation domain-containing protein